MNCKPGDLAIVVRKGKDAKCPPLLGAIVRIDVASPIWSDCWMTSPKIIDARDGCIVHVQDAHLRPIRDPGDDAVDETLLRLPSPRQEETA